MRPQGVGPAAVSSWAVLSCCRGSDLRLQAQILGRTGVLLVAFPKLTQVGCCLGLPKVSFPACVGNARLPEQVAVCYTSSCMTRD